MTVFVVIPQPNPNTAKLAAVVTEMFRDALFPLEGQHGWLISTTGTAQALSEKLGIASGDNGAALVLEVASYFGRATPDTWSWIKTKMESPPGV
jgi:hypothetical protein